MKLGINTAVRDLVEHVPRALTIGPSYKDALARIARERYDWTSVAMTLSDEIRKLEKR
jgi:hypothetical protein